MSDITLEALATEIRQRLDGIDAKVSDSIADAKIADIVKAQFDSILAADTSGEWLRKLRFGDEKELTGTKYARLGTLSLFCSVGLLKGL